MNRTTAARMQARERGIKLAAKITGIAGIAIAAFGAAEAQAAQAAKTTPSIDERGALPLEDLQVRGGSCGCTPCWGPPAPPPARGAA